MSITELLAGASSGGAFVGAAAYVIVQLVNGRREARTKPSGAVTDFATLNAALNIQNDKLQKRVDEQDQKIAALQAHIDDAREKYRAEIEALQAQLDQFVEQSRLQVEQAAKQIAELQRQLSDAQARLARGGT